MLLRRERVVLERQPKAIPDVHQRFGQEIDQRVLVIGRRGNAQPLAALRHGRIVDRLDIDAVLFQQEVAGLLAFLRITDESGTIWVSLCITGRPAAESTALTRAARS